jgi:hypothetical protein
MSRSRWVWALTRVQAAMVFLQAVLAGGVLSGWAGFRVAHGVNAGLLWVVSIAVIVAATVGWRTGRSPGWVAGAAAALWVALEVQIASGESGLLWLHVPLGMAIFGTTVAIVLGTRTRRRFADASPPSVLAGRPADPPQLPPPPAPLQQWEGGLDRLGDNR